MSSNKQLFTQPNITNITKKNTFTDIGNKSNNITKNFTKFLQPCIALNQTLREEAFKIRHDVYCEELAFENIRQNRQETDEFDERSKFSLIKHKPTGEFTSCIRVVTSSNSNELLPIEKYCLDAITNTSLTPDNFNRSEIGELSRLALKYNFRQRKTDEFKNSVNSVIKPNTYSAEELRSFPFISIGLYMSSAIMSMKSGINHIYVMMEPKLARSMKFIGINFQQLGPAVNYHGLRAPYYINSEIFHTSLSSDFYGLYKSIEASINLQLNDDNLTAAKSHLCHNN
jgi:N-acyl amino acid synthase of PEP-CTERM/exosortase system